MSFVFCSLASGSKGNCLYVKSPQNSFLIDLGISLNLLKTRLKEIGATLEDITAVMISHEHSDHIAGLKSLFKEKKIPIFANLETAKGIYQALNVFLDFKIFTTDEPFEFSDVLVHPFSISHDTLDPVGFMIEIAKKVRIGICTDLGMVTPLIKKRLANCHILYLEANHEVSYVHSSSRPDIYKQRVLGRQGHLSNEKCAQLIVELMHPELKHVFLAHLSSECNSSERAYATIQEMLRHHHMLLPKISIAKQEGISDKITWEISSLC